MESMTNGPTHEKARWTRPRAYRSSLAQPRKTPQIKWLRSSCNHVLGIALIWKNQSIIAWKACR